MADIRDLEARAQAFELSDDPTFRDDFSRHLRDVEGSGWTIETSRALDRDDAPGRDAAWRLAGRGATVCALDLPVLDPAGDPVPIGRAVAPRTGIDPGGFAPRDRDDGDRPEAVADGRLDVVAVAGREIVLVRDYHRPASMEGEIDPDDLPVNVVAPLVYTAEAWEPPADHGFSLWLAVHDDGGEDASPPAGDGPRLVRVEGEGSPPGEWSALVEDPGRFVRLRVDEAPPGRDGPPPSELRFRGPSAEALRAVPPCRGAVVGACLLHLLDAQRGTTRLGVVELDELQDGVPDALGIDASIAAAQIRGVVDDSPLLSLFKLGNAVYPYLSPGGIARAAELSHRLGGDVTPDEALERMAGQNTSIASTIKDIQHRSRRGDLSPYYGGRR